MSQGLTQEESIEYVKKVLLAVKGREGRFRTAIKRRKLLADYLSRNEIPTIGPVAARLDFIQKSAQKVINLLGTLGIAFNAAHSDDIATVHDFLDILRTAENSMKPR